MKKLCVIFGGASPEHDISIITAMQLCAKMEEKYKIEKIYLDLNNRFFLATKIKDLLTFNNKSALKLKEIIISNGSVYFKGALFKKAFDIDCVINCCHGGVGENGSLAGFFETNGIKHTSASPLSAHIAMNKSLAKELIKDIVPVVKGFKVNKNNYNEMYTLIDAQLNDDLIVKPNSLGSSIGVKPCTKQNYTEQINAIFEMGDEALVENRIVSMQELNQAAYLTSEGLNLSAIENPICKSSFLTFEDKYNNSGKGKGEDRVVPAKISPELEEKIIEATTKIYNKLNMQGVVRIDYILDLQSNTLYFNEINTIPGSMAFYLFEPVGKDYIALMEELIENATFIKPATYFNTNILKNKKIGY